MSDMSVTVGTYLYSVILWEPSMPVLVADKLAIDTETKYIINGDPIESVLMQVCSHEDRTIHVVVWHDIDDYLESMFQQNITATYIFHNAPFDLHVLGMDSHYRNAWSDLVSVGRIVDTGIRFILSNMLEGNGLIQWKLDLAAKRKLGIEVAKDEEIRLTFHRGMELTERHIKYAAIDAAVTIQLEMVMDPLPTELDQLMGFIALSSISRQGMLVDKEYMHAKREILEEEVKKNQWIAGLFGWRKGVSGNSSVLQQVLLFLEKEMGVTFPRTPKAGTIKMSDETMEFFEDLPDHAFLIAYRSILADNKVITTYMNEDLIGTDGRVHTVFAPLVKTGRTSSSKPNIQNLPRKGGVRGIYVPPEDHVFYACDYSQLELCSLAETCYLLYGKSTMQDIINSGEDLHKWFGQQIMKAYGGTPEEKNWRQMAKACNFGYPGGMGVHTFIRQAFDAYGVVFTVEQAMMLKELWLDAYPEMQYHLKPLQDPNSYTIKTDDGAYVKVRDRYIARTINGRIRMGATYCSACNYPFQGLAADGAKRALWYLYLAGFNMVNFIHDETITELRRDNRLHEQCKRIDDLMLSGMRHVIKNTRIAVEGALMERWFKEAEPIFDSPDMEDRKLLVWHPDVAAEAYMHGNVIYDDKGRPIKYDPPSKEQTSSLIEV